MTSAYNNISIKGQVLKVQEQHYRYKPHHTIDKVHIRSG